MQSRLVVRFTIMYRITIEEFLLHNVALINASPSLKLKCIKLGCSIGWTFLSTNAAASFLSSPTHVLLDKYIGGREI